MKIEHIDGDLLDFPNGINVACHCANTLNVFGAGIALNIKNRYPKAYDADTDYYNQHEGGISILGSYSAARVDAFAEDEKTIVNLYGQAGVGRGERQVNYEAMYSSMEKLKINMTKNSHKQYVLGFPYLMASHLAGGDFNIILAMIKSIFEPCNNIKVYIVKLPQK